MLFEERFDKRCDSHRASSLRIECDSRVFTGLNECTRFPSSRSRSRKARTRIAGECNASAIIITGGGEMKAPRLVTLVGDAQRQSRSARVEIVDLRLAPRALAGGNKSVSQREARHGKESPSPVARKSVPSRYACMRLGQ